VHRSLVPLPPPPGAPKCITISGTLSTNTPRDRRTLNVARLKRGGNYPSVRAARYVNRPVRSEGISEVVESPAPAVMHIAAVVGHTLAPYPLDEGDPGRYYACQAERLLVACFVGRYVFRPRGCEVEACKTDALHKRLAEITGGVIAAGGRGRGRGRGMKLGAD
jgi:hypothetical protein